MGVGVGEQDVTLDGFYVAASGSTLAKPGQFITHWYI